MDGATGAAGADGAPGADGTDGLDGADGATGVIVEDSGTQQGTGVTTINFGANISATVTGTEATVVGQAGGGGGGLSAVTSDATLDGDGTTGDPLGVADGGVGTTQLADDAVTQAKLANNSVHADADRGERRRFFGDHRGRGRHERAVRRRRHRSEDCRQRGRVPTACRELRARAGDSGERRRPLRNGGRGGGRCRASRRRSRTPLPGPWHRHVRPGMRPKCGGRRLRAGHVHRRRRRHDRNGQPRQRHHRLDHRHHRHDGLHHRSVGHRRDGVRVRHDRHRGHHLRREHEHPGVRRHADDQRRRVRRGGCVRHRHDRPRGDSRGGLLRADHIGVYRVDCFDAPHDGGRWVSGRARRHRCDICG